VVIILVGGQWGDEGKGKVIDYLASKAQMVIRTQGGNNAGHTVVTAHGEFKFQLMPSGVLYEHCTCVIGNGVVVDPIVLLREISQLRERGIEPKKLVVSERAHMVMRYHPLFDQLEEESRGDDRLGTTWRGIGPAYSDKIRRIGFRIGDLQKEAFMRKKLAFVVGQVKNPILTKLYDREPYDIENMLAEYMGYARELDPFIKDTFPLIQDALDSGSNILLEGAQATMLDLDFGTYPYVTSSNPTAGGALTGSGIPPTRVDLTIGVFKAYTSRVGYGPFPSELLDEIGDQIRDRKTTPHRLVRRGRRAIRRQVERGRVRFPHAAGHPRRPADVEDLHGLQLPRPALRSPSGEHLPLQALRAGVRGDARLAAGDRWRGLLGRPTPGVPRLRGSDWRAHRGACRPRRYRSQARPVRHSRPEAVRLTRGRVTKPSLAVS
jgi:adenylosuccinate synthase